MTVSEREQIIRDIFENEFIPLIRAKGHDYAVDGDALANLRETGGLQGIVIRIGDKYSRLKGFVRRMGDGNEAELKVKDESIEDTLLDSIAYNFFALIFQRGLHEK